MSKEKIELTLNYVDNEHVDLSNMSIKSLDSFLLVTNCLKNIAESVSTDVTFTIKKGSAYTAVNGSSIDIGIIVDRMKIAIDGESSDEIITSNLRNIQKEIQNTVFNYQFKYADFNIEDKLRHAKKIAKKRSKNSYNNELHILSGYFNSIGGNEPNYHFDHGGNQKTTIECSIKDANELKHYLYKTISCLVKKKYAIEAEDKITYNHCSVLNDIQVKHFRQFTSKLNITEDLFERLDLFYDFFDESTSKIEDMAIVLKSYHFFVTDPNELKTLLIITKGLKEHPKIKEYRESLLNDFNLLMSKI